MTMQVRRFSCTAGLAILALALFGSSAHGALVISSGDIVQSGAKYTYTYSLGFAQMASGNTTFDNDVYQKSNVYVNDETVGTPSYNNRYVVTQAGTTSAYLTYKFDFTDTGYAPVSVNFLQSIMLHNWDTEVRDVVIAYSKDGQSWVTLLSAKNSVDANGNAVTYQANGSSYTVNGLTGSTVYYKVTFAAETGTFVHPSTQWNRVSSTNISPFTATFTLVPVPECATILVLGTGLVLLTRRARR